MNYKGTLKHQEKKKATNKKKKPNDEKIPQVSLQSLERDY